MKSIQKFLQAINTPNLCVTGTKIGEQAFLISNIKTPVFFVVGDSETGFKAEQQLIALGKNCVLLDSADNPFIISKYQSKDNTIKLVKTLYECIKNKVEVLIITPQILNVKLGKCDVFARNILTIKQDCTIEIEDINKHLTKCGYVRVDSVQNIGEFAIRGDIVDIYPPNHSFPIRINFFDNLVESVIHFDNINLSKIDDIVETDICPMTTCIIEDNEYINYLTKLSLLAEQNKENKLYELLSQFEINKSLPIEYLSLLGFDCDNIFDYISNARIIVSNPLHVRTQLEQLQDENIKLLNNLFANQYIVSKLSENNIDYLNDNTIVFDNLGNFKSKNILDLPTKNLSSYLYKTDLIKFELASVRNKHIHLCLDNDYTYNSIKNILMSNSVAVNTDTNAYGVILTNNKLPYNVCFNEDEVWYIGSSNFAHKKEFVKTGTKKIKFLPKAGEFVVHEVHGIGKCEGVVTLNVMGADKDFFKIVYRNNDILYVPTENTNSLSLYMGDEGRINLNKLGGKEFALHKAHTKQAIEDMAKDLLVLYSKRQASKGHKYSEDDYLCTEFDNAFEHQETVDQMQAIQDIKRDMTSGKVMDRLVCGDVGYGKTEVAMRAAFKTCIEGKQVAVLAPTTILSLQHFMTFSKRFKDFDIRIEMLNRFKTAKEKAEIIKKLKNGEIDIVCGTHSLVADSIGFKDLGLLILDEEQRFGVKAKEKLKDLKHNVNVLTMSATPIPRTLNLALLTLRDISIINTPPQHRLPVKTYVIPFDIKVVAQAIDNELKRDGQVLVVYNDIDKIYALASTLRQNLSCPANIDVAHGQMTRTELENAVKRLYDSKTNVFISTTLIENGVDLPSANTLIVVDSQNLGLSQMYQLRGRVGRSNKQAYAYFTYPQGKTLTLDATNRLQALAENTELGSGFKIAMRDLQLRGAGELLGKSQHGHMVKVGYDMYVKLLEETTKRLMGEKVKVVNDVKLDIAINARIPNDFVQDETEKLKIYSKISNIVDVNSQKQVIDELKSNYLRLPREVVQLTNVALIKSLAQQLNIKHIVIDKNNMFVEYYEDAINLDELLKDMAKFSKFSLKKSILPTIKLNSNEFSPDTAQGYIIGYLLYKIDNNSNK